MVGWLGGHKKGHSFIHAHTPPPITHKKAVHSFTQINPFLLPPSPPAEGAGSCCPTPAPPAPPAPRAGGTTGVKGRKGKKGRHAGIGRGKYTCTHGGEATMRVITYLGRRGLCWGAAALARASARARGGAGLLEQRQQGLDLREDVCQSVSRSARQSVRSAPFFFYFKQMRRPDPSKQTSTYIPRPSGPPPARTPTTPGPRRPARPSPAAPARSGRLRPVGKQD